MFHTDPSILPFSRQSAQPANCREHDQVHDFIRALGSLPQIAFLVFHCRVKWLNNT
jgi:hypothetical protein